ncbi:cyclin-T1-4 [Vigna radiata var. radiata]|uniref:B-like cyclin n=1 Tax=Vigna radiata var. radiata TaxID=3916 RepID=A0A1S3UTK4_VIGRR|nr:cyclin-T1-4 [Vigna radiata var. radiata]XP_014509411.1 cyclin-T1-4 [Vigna radiata var. radiata]XP_022638817.1 cyclin-T1-4 [Vigna radiata var. radiata]
MAGLMPGELPNHGPSDGNSGKSSKDKQEESLGRWYMSRKEIEEHSPSRKDGIDLKKETYLRKSYCTFLQDLGMRLKVPQVTIATAIIFCHRFFLRQSHAKNDRRTIATVCMFLAGKVEETPRPLKDVILVSYEIIHKKDPAAAQRIKQKEVYEQQKELILLGERVVLATLAFDLNVQHPYKPLVEAIKKFNVAKNALAQVAWNFVNDGLRTSLCLQFKPHHIAAGAIFLAAKFLKVKLPSDGEKVWWQEFDVTPRQLEEVSNQMLELYEQNRIPPAQGSEVEGSAGGTRSATKAPAVNEDQASKQISSQAPQHSSVERTVVPQRGTENQSNDGSAEMGSDITDHKMDLDNRESQNSEQLTQKDNKREMSNRSKSGSERIVAGDQDRMVGTKEGAEVGRRDESALYNSGSNGGRNMERREGPISHSPKEAIKMIDKDKVKAAMEKRRKERGEMTVKKDVMDEDDLIERELEDGVELAVEDEKNKRERRQNWSKHDGEDHHHEETRDGRHTSMKGQFQKDMDEENAEEGEMIDDASSSLNNRKRKMGSPPGKQPEMKKRPDSSYHNDPAE